jgi:arylsulfatase A-like enzyme
MYLPFLYKKTFHIKKLQDGLLTLLLWMLAQSASAQSAVNKTVPSKPRNIIFILADDHRYDFMGFTSKVPGLQTPNMDRLAREGAHIENAFVSTALCSPSRASILTGQYAHTHTIVDNQAPLPKGLNFFPQYLQKAGYKTAFLGKWHMGNQDGGPQPGFDYWLSFNGQGVYYNPAFNINGKIVKHTDSSYTTDLLTDYALDWMKKQDKNKPFFLYLSHKAVHADFSAAKRHKGMYKDTPIAYPQSMYLTASDSSKIFGAKPSVNPELNTSQTNIKDIPDWVKKQRYSWHGVDYMYHGQTNFNKFYKDYIETLMGVDESIGRVLAYLKATGLDESTMVIYMGDNGFSFGEHGLIDKRHMYEESMRVPLLMRCPEMIKANTKITQVIQNVDIAPTILATAGVQTPKQMQGKSFLPILKGNKIEWRDKAFYEYYWEYDYPQTPTMFGVRTDRYKYIFNHGVWDANELYDLQNDPMEMNNLIRSPQHQEIAKSMRDQVWEWLESTGGMQIPIKAIPHKRGDHRYENTY